MEQSAIPVASVAMPRLLLRAAFAVLVPFCGAQAQPPSAAMPVVPVAADTDTDYPGVLTLAVDVSDVERRVFRVRESIPVAPGPLTLLYPKWLPGNHAPTGPIEQLAGLTIRAGGERLAWWRDPVDLHAFHLDVPAAVDRLDVEFQFASPLDPAQGRIVATPAIVGLQWNTVALYPAGHAANRIRVEPSLRMPEGWQFGSALEVAARDGATTRFAPVTLETLIDSPVFAGRHFRRFDLDPGAAQPVHLNVVADAALLLDASPAMLEAHRELVRQAYRLYGGPRYEHYDFLLALSDTFARIGLEHHRSSENATFREYLTDPLRIAGRDLLAHEFTHSWNGKYRRPAGLATANYSIPMQGSLLWVYEGQTQYWGHVLAARAGLWTPEQAREALALVAATYDHREGRAWRSLADTTAQPALAYRKPLAWPSWQRAQDYYSEGQLIWLDADTKLRELSGGRRSLDDFARAFFGGADGKAIVSTYAFDDVVAALQAAQPYDWAGFLRERVDGHGPGAPLDGLARGGWRLVYTDVPNVVQEDDLRRRKAVDFNWSLGLSLAGDDGRITEVLWDSPAFKAGLAASMRVVAVDGEAYSGEVLRRAVADAKGGATPIELLIRDVDRYRSVRLDYHEGVRVPHLERVAGTPDRLGDILAPRRR